MINSEQKKVFESFLKSCNQQQLIWSSGYLQGIVDNKSIKAVAEIATTLQTVEVKKPDINIYYATETGNSKMLSMSIMKSLKNSGFKSKAVSVNRLKMEDLEKSKFAIFLVSTHGEGDPPEGAIEFFNKIKESSGNPLQGLGYSMLGLGDRSYEIFCGAATNLDQELKRLGAKNFNDIALFDVDYNDHVQKWIDQTVEDLNKKVGSEVDGNKISGSITNDIEASDNIPKIYTGKGYSRLQPVTGTIRSIVNLNDIDSKKQTYHIEISYDDNIIYTPGDAVGIILPKDKNDKEQTPRLYSIASSPSMHEKEIHLTVALATHFDENGQMGYGISSYYLANKKPNDKINFYISQNHLFNLPPSPDQNIIMIGPGTGIAPFRSFIYERLELGHEGKNWLFFGDQHAHCDFLYQTEWQEHLATGALEKIDLAFSRDQSHKVYVQHRMKENADDLILWLEDGAALYVCGSKDPMSKDVEQALIDIISEKKSISLKQSQEYLTNLEEQNRYFKDVY